MRTLALLTGLLLAGSALAQNAFEPKFTAGDTANYKISMTFRVGGNTAVFSGKLAYKVMDAGEKIKHAFDWTEHSVKVEEQDQEIPMSKIEVTTDKNLLPLAVTGGIEGSDQARTFLIAHAILPEGELKADEEKTRIVPKSEALGTDELTIKTKFLGEEEVNGVKAYKLDYKLEEKGTGFKVKSVVWATKAGQIVKLKGSFEEIPVPAVGANASGEVTLDKS